ncbi:integrin alpha [Luteolibacter sp. GHJ8]|uniref:Integrin alpha n=1 Tax=Luteolibacter rhizosphaerae TaxID=2989719 RepID=A0ABT3FZS4_9BACT|nr:integrin alpha [Luteolibacter rhizosphaerae]MCW1913090.1 integrin alpha [Luteolibacter rhizosphaerae]
MLQTITAASPGAASLFGAALAGAGDQNADGKDDLFIGAPGAAALNGSVLVVSGADGSLIRTLAPLAPATEFGASLATVGDLSGDGLLDLAVGSPGAAAGSGSVQLIRSSDATEVAAHTGIAAGARLGSRIGLVDDRNADSVADLVAGSGSGGSAFLLSGSNLTLITELSLAGAAAGQPVASGGALDVDQNGITELLIGYPGATPLPKVSILPAPLAPEPSFYEGSAGGGLGTAVAAIEGLGFAIGEPLLGGGAVHVYTAAIPTATASRTSTITARIPS